VIKFEVDEPKRLLVIRYRGVVEAEETEKGLEQIRNGLTKLQSGFRLLADLSELQSMEVACAPFIEKAMDMCNKKGASMVVRVIPDPRRRHRFANHVDLPLPRRRSNHYLPNFG